MNRATWLKRAGATLAASRLMPAATTRAAGQLFKRVTSFPSRRFWFRPDIVRDAKSELYAATAWFRSRALILERDGTGLTNEAPLPGEMK